MSHLSPASLAALEPDARRAWPLTVVGACYVTPRVRRVRLVSDVDGFSYRPGQGLLLTLADTVLRHDAVRDFDPVEERLEVDFVLRSDSPTSRWARAVVFGDRVMAEKPPRGRAAGA